MKTSQLTYFPIAIFATVLGLSGLTMAWQRAEQLFNFSFVISNLFLGLTILVFAVIFLIYIFKIFLYTDAVKQELKHPIKLNFFPAISICFILFGVNTFQFAPKVSLILWATGTFINLLVTLYVLNVWINHQHLKIEHLNPAWFIPVVANIVVPLAGVQHGYLEISWFYFSFGLLFWFVLLVLNFYRLIFQPALPTQLLPTLVILIAPPSIGFLAYYNLTAQLDAFARILYYIGLFFFLLIASQVLRLLKLSFTLTWWAYSFPLAAITVSTLTMYQLLGGSFFKSLSLVLLTILSIVLVILITRTVISIARGEICVND